jgi:hypothetical protein
LHPIKQWGFLVKNLDKSMRYWTEVFAVGLWWVYRNVTVYADYCGEKGKMTMNAGLAFQNPMQIELIHQTNHSISPYPSFDFCNKEQVIHQIAYFTPDFDAAVEKAESVGMTK